MRLAWRSALFALVAMLGWAVASNGIAARSADWSTRGATPRTGGGAAASQGRADVIRLSGPSACSGHCQLSATVLDELGQTVKGQMVTLAQSQGNPSLDGIPTNATVSGSRGRTDENGAISFTVSDLLVEWVTFTATDGGRLTSNSVTVGFTPPGITPVPPGVSPPSTGGGYMGCAGVYPGSASGRQKPPSGTTEASAPLPEQAGGGEVMVYAGEGTQGGGDLQAGVVASPGALLATVGTGGAGASAYGNPKRDPAPLGGTNGSLVAGPSGHGAICLGTDGASSTITVP